MPRWVIWSVLGIGALALLLRATWLAPDSIPVQVVAVEEGPVAATVTNTKAGTVRARQRAQLSASIPGRVIEIVQREGDSVKRGAPLLRLADEAQRAQLRLAQESMRAAEASRHAGCISRDRARRELARKRKLAAQRIVSADVLDQLQSVYDAAGASCTAAAAEVNKAAAQVSVVEVELSKTVIRAPFDGVIAEVNVELGEWITPSPPLLTAPAVIDLIDPTSLYVSAPMDEVDSAAIRIGQRVRINIDSFPDREFPGHVVRVAPYVLNVEAQNRTVEIEAELDDPNLSLRLLPGTSADVEVILELRDAVLRIPASALLEGNRVLLSDNGRLSEQAVEVGLRNWDYAEIVGGLRRDQRVVLSLDRVEIKAGARVVVEEIRYRP